MFPCQTEVAKGHQACQSTDLFTLIGLKNHIARQKEDPGRLGSYSPPPTPRQVRKNSVCDVPSLQASWEQGVSKDVMMHRAPIAAFARIIIDSFILFAMQSYCHCNHKMQS